MAENTNETKRINYDIYASASRPFFSYKKPGDGNAYAMVVPQIHSHIVTLKFTKAVTSENRIDLTCYLTPAKLHDFVNILEGIMARRRDAFASHNYYSTDEAFKIPVTSFVSGKEEPVGAITIDTELVDGISRLRITYFQNDKNESVEIVFNERTSNEDITGTLAYDKIDFGDIGAFNFVVTMKELIGPQSSIMYGMINSAVSSITKYISACFSNNRNGGGFSRSNNYQKPSSNNGGGSSGNYTDYDESVF